MARLLQHPELDWTDDGAPHARQHGDVYVSAQDGLAETREVFLKGCGLPEAWKGRTHFTVAETGFGTGLNFLALCQLWRAHRPSPAAQLTFVSFEAYPLRREDAAREQQNPVASVIDMGFATDAIAVLMHYRRQYPNIHRAFLARSGDVPALELSAFPTTILVPAVHAARQTLGRDEARRDQRHARAASRLDSARGRCPHPRG
jgi:tRNA U34 5-methylaminomethyl-2-thiouridine-forming methyltransferase MnmC